SPAKEPVHLTTEPVSGLATARPRANLPHSVMNCPATPPALHVAVINDHPLQRKMLCSILASGGHLPVPHVSAAEALEAFNQTVPDLIVTDLNMPGIDGWHFCRLIRQHTDPNLRRVPILAVSATFEGEESERLIVEMGADAFLPVPIRADSLLSAVAQLKETHHRAVPQAVLLVSPNPELIHLWQQAFTEAGHRTLTAPELSQAATLLGQNTVDSAILLLDPQPRERLSSVASLLAPFPKVAAVSVTADPDPALALEAVQRGLGLHLRLPVDPRYLVTVLERLRENRALAQVQKLLEEKSASLQDAIRRLRLAVEHANVGLWVWNLATNTVEYSPEWKRQLGYDLDEIADTFDEWENRLHPDDRESAVAYVRRFIQSNGTLYRQEFRLRHKNGSYRRILAQGCFVRDANHRAIQLIGTHIDLTELKQLEEDRLRFERDLHHAQKLESLGVLAGGIAHDFNNLLMAVMGQLELAQLDTEPQSTAGLAIAEALTAVSRASDLTRQLLVYSGKARQQIVDLNLNTLVSDNLRLFRAAVPKHIVLDCQLAPALPLLRADAAQLQQVVMNLITNAAEAIHQPGGRVLVRTGHRNFATEELLRSRLGNHPPAGPYVWLEVTDNGSGMDEATAKRIFDPFFTTKKTGRGLGMASVIGILRSHRGAILLESTPGQGTTITVLFPLSP
ncbi:MAG: response regulator, partial [Verrucomicrobiia bacterium]